ncbi:Dihydroorotase [Frankliniella fusca]|uniref:Dihydroorotase n=1 Tax=Frankliniella fusca TaxID=407009 RepID=A0AAE1LSQ0_9NEOP|nr:Dihydroorotase [Frankliniella fusca]
MAGKRKGGVTRKSHDCPAKSSRRTRSNAEVKENVPPDNQQPSGSHFCGGPLAGRKSSFVPPTRTLRQIADAAGSNISVSSMVEEPNASSSSFPLNNKGNNIGLVPPTHGSSDIRNSSTQPGVSSIEKGSCEEAAKPPQRKERGQFVPPTRISDLSSVAGCSTSTETNADKRNRSAFFRPTYTVDSDDSEAGIVSGSESGPQVSFVPTRISDLSSVAGCSTSTEPNADKRNRSAFFRPKYTVDSDDSEAGIVSGSESGSKVSFVPSHEDSSEDDSTDGFESKDDADKVNTDGEQKGGTEQTDGIEQTLRRDNHSANDSISQDSGSEDSETQRQSRSRMRNQDGNSKRSRVKRRLRQPISASRLERKEARNSGEAYVTMKGKHVPARAPASLPKCQRDCATKITPEIASHLCDGLWKGLADHSRRSSFVASLIDVNPKASQKLNSSTPPKGRKPKTYSYKYHLSVNGERVQVCKGCFCKVLNVSSKFIEIALHKKLSNVAGLVGNDKRGKTSSSSVSERQRQEVKDHLNSFPHYESHYARNKTDKKFLSNNLTLKIMYDDYCKKHCSTTPVSRWIYEKEFHEMGLKIKPFKMDTCNTCDKLAAEIMYASNDEDRNSKLEEQKIHHTKWKLAQEIKNKDIKEAKKNEKVEVICFDLQQCLPTPHLQTSIIFYKRQLWVYNLTVHICSNDRSVHNMWHEGEGERGPNQIGSALYHYALGLSDDIEHLVLWSDTCGGQNKNSIVTAALQTILKHKQSLKVIDQKFLVPGHTHLECDRDHSVIEAKKKQATSIFVPRDWFNLVETANKKFSVNRLTQQNMLNFKALLKGRDSPLVKRAKNTSGEIFSWKKTVWLRHSRELGDGVVAYKESFKEEESFKLLNIRRRKTGQLMLQPGLAYSDPVPISANKKKDLLSLLYLIDPECHSFYHGLRSADQDDVDPDLRGETDEDESEGE